MSSDETLRDARGRWMVGTPGPNPNGRPRRVVEESTLKALSEVWTENEVKEVAKVMLGFAKAGNIAAATTILHYQAGKPTDRIDLTGSFGNALGDLSDDQIDQILADHNQQALGDGAAPSADVVETVE